MHLCSGWISYLDINNPCQDTPSFPHVLYKQLCIHMTQIKPHSCIDNISVDLPSLSCFHIIGLVHDCGISSALALEIPQSCSELLTSIFFPHHKTNKEFALRMRYKTEMCPVYFPLGKSAEHCKCFIASVSNGLIAKWDYCVLCKKRNHHIFGL